MSSKVYLGSTGTKTDSSFLTSSFFPVLSAWESFSLWFVPNTGLPKGISSLPAAFSAKAYCRYENDFAARLMIPFLEDSIKMRCRIMDCKKKNYFVKKFL